MGKMNNKLMIHVLNEFNDDNILTTLQYKPEKVIFIREKDQEAIEIYRDVKEYLRSKIKGIFIDDRIYDSKNHMSIIKVVEELIEKKPIVHLSEVDNPLLSALLVQKALSNDLKLLISDKDGDEVYELLSNGSCKVEYHDETLKVEDLVLSTGGEIASDSSDEFDEAEFNGYIKWIISNYRKFNKIKRIIRSKNIMAFDAYHPLNAKINLFGLENNDRELVEEYIKLLENENIIEIDKDNGLFIEITIKQEKFKQLVRCGGLWLELLTYSVVNSLDDIDDVKFGMKFAWNREQDSVENELDVVFMRDNRLYCISCKDTSTYESAQLNELEVYSEQIGGQDSVKALVTTEEPRKSTVMDRAEEMGIEIIILNGDIEKFKRDLLKLFNK